MKKIMMFIMALLLITPVNVNAEGYSQLENIIPDEARQVMEEMDIESLDTKAATDITLTDFFIAIMPNLEKSIITPIKALGTVLGILLVSALLNIIKKGDGNKTYDIAVSAVCALCVATPVSGCIVETVKILSAMTDFMLSYVPVYTGLLIASGTPSAAASYSSALIISSEAVSQFVDKAVIPLTGMILGVSLISGISSNEIFIKLPNAAKSFTRWIFVTVTSAFIGLLSVQTTIAAAGDSLLLKSGKTLAGFVPIAGSAVSDALSVTFGSFSVIKSGVGIFGIVIILIIFLPTLFKLMIWTGGMKLMSAASDTLGTKGIKNVLTGVGDALDMLIAVYTSVGVIFVISTAVMIKVAV